MDISLDFDGTCVSHEYPKIGKDIGAQPILNKLIKADHRLILYTMRSGKELEEAIEWFKINNIPLYGIQYNPTQKNWTQSNKCYAHLYIGDDALGCPLLFNPAISNRAYADWDKINKILFKTNVLN